jgi:hypothetical protein
LLTTTLIIVLIIGLAVFENVRYAKKPRLVLHAGEWVSSPLNVTQIIMHSKGSNNIASGLQHRWLLVFLGTTACGKNCSDNFEALTDIQTSLSNTLSGDQLPVVAIITNTIESQLPDSMVTLSLPFETSELFFKAFNLSHSEADKGQAKLLLVDPRGQIQASFNLPNQNKAIVLDIVQVERKQNASKHLSL